MKTQYMMVLVSLLASQIVVAQDPGANQTAAVVETLTKYAAAIQSKSISAIENYVVTTDAFTMFEGGHVNWGWADYRDNHLGPELKEFKEIQYSFEGIQPHVSGDMAYATFKYHIAVKMEARAVEGDGLATAILVKTTGGWKIQHMHTSRILPKRPDEKK